jgi:protein-glucosylgalactosylhydroxylysine glucosidase
LRGLEAARHKASLFGYAGAMFPCEAGLDGAEVTPSEADTAWSEQHFVVDIALAFREYYQATGDKDFLRRGSWPVLRDVANWIASRGEFTTRGFEIRKVQSPDEVFPCVDNSIQMNSVARQVMKGAIRCAAEVEITPPPIWQRIADNMVLPIDPQRSILVPFDGANPDPANARYSTGITFLSITHDLDLDLGLLKRTFNFEESLREVLPNHQGIAGREKSPGFITPPYAVGAAMAGDRRKAAKLFRYGWENFLLAPYGICKEYQPYRDGCYLMNLSSLMQAAVYGFTGMRITDGEWCKYPATLPEGWAKIEVDRLWIKGKPMRLMAEHGKRAVLTPLKESPQ